MRQSPLMARCDVLEQRLTVPPGPAYALRLSPYRWNGLGWLMEAGRDLEAVAFVLAMRHDDEGVKRLIEAITTPDLAADSEGAMLDRIAGSDRKLPTERQIVWLCEYLRALWPSRQHEPLIQHWLHRCAEIEEENR